MRPKARRLRPRRGEPHHRDGLQRLDSVAFIRFASVYRDFSAARDFEEFAASVRAFRDLVARMPEATFCVMMTGEADYLLKIVARDLPHFQEIVQSKLLRCAAIAHMESSIVLEHLKDTTELPLA